MTDQEGSKINDDYGLDDNNDDAEDLFNDIVVQNEDKQEQKKGKRLRKAKKDKKSKKQKKDKKKKRRHQQDQEKYGYDQEQEEERNSLFDDEAESDDQQNYSQDRSAQIGQQQENDRFNEMINKPSTRENYFKRFAGKNDRDINALYSRGATMLRQNEAMYPVEHEPKIYIVNVKPRHEDQLVLYILNKARHLAETSNKVSIITVTSLRKKFSGKIFVQAFSQKDVRDSLQGFATINLGKNLIQLDREGYVQLFNQKFQSKIQFQQLNYVRINKGLYEDDLAQILKIKNNSVDVAVVPRLNVQQISIRIRQQATKITDLQKRKEKMSQLLDIFLEYKSNNFKKKPNKQILSQELLRQQLGDILSVKKIKLAGSPPGLIILNFKFDQISKNKGSIRPVQMMPFTSSQGNFIGKMTEQKANFTTQTDYKKGQEVQIVSGGMIGHFGIIYQLLDNVATIICKNKDLKNQKIYQSVDNIMKKFKKGQRVKVISGDDIGKTGIVLKIQQKLVQILTDNYNSIRINKRNLQVSTSQTICQQNVHKLNKNDLIKTSKNQIGIVLETTKDNIKMLDTNNTLQLVSNMDFDSKLNTRNIVAKNRSGDQITAGCLIIIRQGLHQGKKCKVIHVYRQNLFLFNAQFNRTGGITVQNAQHCALMSKNQQPQQSRSFSAKGANLGTSDPKDQITVGKTIILRSGPLKGYQGVVKSINKDKIEVRVLSKACTQWVPRQNVSAKQQTIEIGKTPNRKGGNTHNYVAPSPSRY